MKKIIDLGRIDINKLFFLIEYVSKMVRIFLLILVFGLFSLDLLSQVSPSNWIYPSGNLNATNYNNYTSKQQTIDSFVVKWSTEHISGNTTPLIGNIISNDKILNFDYKPNEIVAVMGDSLVLISGTGSLIKKTLFPSYISGIKSVSCLIDTLATDVGKYSDNPLIIGLESIEQFNPRSKDSLAVTYLFGYNDSTNNLEPIKRLAINLRQFAPNIFASIKPVFGKSINGRLMVYATVNMALPIVPEFPTGLNSFFRGLTQFYDVPKPQYFPLPDIEDDPLNRVYLGAEVNLGQPSIIANTDGNGTILLPSFPTTDSVSSKYKDNFVNSDFKNGSSITTYMDKADILGINFGSMDLDLGIYSNPFVNPDINRPYIRPYYIDIQDNGPIYSGQPGFLLITEGYKGMDGSYGRAKIHLADINGSPITSFELGTDFTSSYGGDSNHYWGVSVGNIDGNDTNKWLPYYPNNRGKEIVVTQSSKEFAFPGSILSILRYKSGDLIEKPTAAGQYLYEFDTICTQRMNGWVAAINNIDGSNDGKDEIFLVDGSKLVIIRMRNYSDYKFRLGNHFDTLYTKEFFNQVITSVAIADLEGDGKNDIIVTTDDSLYVIGNIIPNTLLIVNPNKKNINDVDVCVGDTLDVKWVNVLYSQDKVDLEFKYGNIGDTVESLFTSKIIARNIDNKKDTVVYRIIVDSVFAGLRGRFFVNGVANVKLLRDSSGIVNFHFPQIYDDSLRLDRSIYSPGDNFILSGLSNCSEKLELQVQLDSINWQSLVVDTTFRGGNFDISGEIPCLSDYFRCDAISKDTLLYFRLISEKYGFSDTSKILSVDYEPNYFKVKIDTAEIADPTQYFDWEIDQFDSTFIDKNLTIMVSKDYGMSFEFVLSVPLKDESAKWFVPVDLPDTVIYRLCIEGTCYRKDTIIYGVKPTYIDIVAPNPFNPDIEELQIVYHVPEDTRVTIIILDQNNKLVAEIVNSIERKKGIVYGDYWNGKRYDGASAANGMYYVVLEFGNGNREIYPVYVRK